MREYLIHNVTALRVLCETGPHDTNIRDYIWNMPDKGEPRILTTYSVTTPESAEQGDFAESGWIDEVGEPMLPEEYDREEGKTAVDKAVDWLEWKGAGEASASHFHPGVWYSSQSTSYRTGETTEYNFHLKGFTEQEEEEVFNRMQRRR